MSSSEPISPTVAAFRAMRDALLEHRTDPRAARAAWQPLPDGEFNWATDWFDALAADPRHADQPALVIVSESGRQSLTYAELSARSQQVGAFLAAQGVAPGDRVLLMLGNQVELWETMLACIRIGAVTSPATTLLTAADLRDRMSRGNIRHAVVGSAVTSVWRTVEGDFTRIAVGEPVEGWTAYDDARSFDGEPPRVVTRAHDPMLLYFTSGTTAKPKLVLHTQTSYPVGHLSTMYWIGAGPGDVHLNISSAGWAKHAWSNVFAPWNAGATVLVVDQPRFDAAALIEQVVAERATTFCAPPTVYRMLIQADLAAYREQVSLREMVGAGEPLNPEVIGQVERALGITVRDGFGQTETTCQVGNTPGQPVVPGSMGQPLPGYDVVLVDPATGAEGDEGELCLRLDGPLGRPVGLMVGYEGDEAKTAEVMRDGVYHTGDVASRDAEGNITYVGRADDVFKASDYRISPFELESVLIEHPAVAEAAVVPSPDPTRLTVPKAYVVLTAANSPSPELARDILAFAREHLAPYKRIRRIEFAELPKTISGKIRRVELRQREVDAHGTGGDDSSRASDLEYWETDFPDLKG
ncbi:AMP-binding protein [Calidifontibacter sp. DB0510]|uniref:AMP-binding protein n=1 Tax=Metallococcus carri TaxID=1656884 RepID=A0A967B156_9MICO|nr:AMP-binding protein [Metallococcus carri]NHN56886.1 AMP-binding protein [Metallococcus carri]NOP37631.1 AMP-binding protein [Calidifontibacter sp. DB2511S]